MRMNRKGTRLLFRKSDKVLLEYKVSEEKVEPSRGIRFEEGSSIADFAYSRDSKFVFCITDDGILRFRSKQLDKDYIIDPSKESITEEGQYFTLALSTCGRYLAACSNLSDGTVTEHSIYLFELRGLTDPLFVHKLSFITDRCRPS